MSDEKMPDKTSSTNTSEARISKTEEEKFTMMLRQIEGSSFDSLSEEHVSEVLRQRSEVNGFIHSERMQVHERFKVRQANNRVYIVGGFIFSLVVIGVVVYTDKSYLPSVLSLIFGFSGGFGLGKTSGRSSETEE